MENDLYAARRLYDAAVTGGLEDFVRLYLNILSDRRWLPVSARPGELFQSMHLVRAPVALGFRAVKKGHFKSFHSVGGVNVLRVWNVRSNISRLATVEEADALARQKSLIASILRSQGYLDPGTVALRTDRPGDGPVPAAAAPVEALTEAADNSEALMWQTAAETWMRCSAELEKLTTAATALRDTFDGSA